MGIEQIGEWLKSSDSAGVLIAALALVFSLLSTGLTYWMFHKQHSLAYQQFLESKTQEIADWAERVLSIISKMHEGLLLQEQTNAPAVLDSQGLQAELSTLIDVGRWYFPNYDHERVGTNKSYAYRGVRQYTLDLCVYAHDLYREAKAGPAAGRAGRMVHLKREFVSELQLAINPRQLSKDQLRWMRSQVGPGATFKWFSRDGKVNEA